VTADKRTIQFTIKADADVGSVAKFTKSLRELADSAPVTDKVIKAVREGILDFAKSGDVSTRTLESLQGALKKLQSEAKAGGPVYKQLGNDIADARRQLGQLTGTANATTEQLNRLLNAGAKPTFGGLSEQTARLNKELRDLKFRSEDYLRTLTRIKELETVGSFNQGRLNTIAANRAFMGATLNRGYGAPANLPGLPDTLAGDAQLVSELNERIRNLDRGSELYLQTVRELATAQAQAAASQAQLNRAVDGGAASFARINEVTLRRDAKLASIADYYASGNIAERRNDGFGDRPQAQQRGDGALIAPPYRTGNYTGMGDAGLGQFGPKTAGEVQAQIRPLEAAIQQAQQSLDQARDNAARRGAEQSARRSQLLNEVEDQLAAQQLAANKKRDDALLKDFDTRLENRVKRREARRQGLREFGQTATAVGVAGYFGGPEAVAGASLGAFFGPGGAQVGTTVGLAVGGLRQQIAGFSGQAAELSKMQIALKANTTSAQEYARSLNIIENANKQLNIPLQEGTRGFTQLLAAVKGAGGTINDAEIAYRAINSAIKANGGSTQDAEGAMRALVQTFSKGKVSAEELRGQLAERLPGAVTLFAKSIGMTGPELDKALEQGKVGLGDLMKFLVELEKRNYTTAERIAASQEEAGIRLQNKWNDVTLAIGKSFQGLGARIQDDLAKWLKANETSIAQWAKSFGDGIGFALDKLGALVNGLIQADKFLRQLKNPLGIFNPFEQGADPNFSTNNYWKSIGGDSQTRSQINSQLSDVKASIIELEKAKKEIWFPSMNQSRVSDLDARILQQRAKQARLETGLAASPASSPLAPSGLLVNNPADASRRKADAEAERQLRLAQAYADQQQKLLEARTDLEIRLADMVYQHKVDLANKEYERKRNIENMLAEAQIARLNPNQRNAAALLQQFRQFRSEQQDTIRVAEQALEAARRTLEAERRRAAVSAMAPAAIAPMMPSAGGGLATFGSTGNVRNAPGWVHGHFQTNTGTLAQLIADTAPVVMALIRAGVPAELANGVKFRAGMSQAEVVRMLYQAARLHGHSGDGRSIDVFVPEGTKVPVPLSDVRPGSGRGGVTGVLPGSGQSWVGHLARSSVSGGALAKPAVGQFAQERRAAGDQSGVARAEQDYRNKQAALAKAREGQAAEAAAKWELLMVQDTQSMRDNTTSIKENIQQLQDRTRLTLEGFGPEYVNSLVEINSLQRKNNDQIAIYNQELKAAQASGRTDDVARITDLIRNQTDATRENINAIREQTRAQLEANEAMGRGFGYREGARQYVESIGTMREATAELVNGGIKGIEESLFSLATTGTANFREFTANILRDTTRMIIQQFILRALLKAVGFLGGGGGGGGIQDAVSPEAYSVGTGASIFAAANGAAFAGNGIQLFAKGGVVSAPKLFQFANGGVPGLGVMGEAGPEAIMPLRRGPDGRLGVSGGGGTVNVTVNVSADGSQQSEASGDKAAQLGRVVASAVQQEIINQKRPGGLLA